MLKRRRAEKNFLVISTLIYKPPPAARCGLECAQSASLAGANPTLCFILVVVKVKVEFVTKPKIMGGEGSPRVVQTLPLNNEEKLMAIEQATQHGRFRVAQGSQLPQTKKLPGP